MCRPGVFLFIIISTFGLSTISGNRREFHYPNTILRSSHSKAYNCTICDNSSCLKMDNAMCEYHKVTDGMFNEEDLNSFDDNPALKLEIDDLLFRMTEEERGADVECIPYISHYTDCHNHNAYLGCRKCDCDATGRWNCSDTQQCNAGAIFDVDHKVLVGVMENLNLDKIGAHVRKKRSKRTTISPKMDEEDEKLTSQEIMTLINMPNNYTTLVKNLTINSKNISSDMYDETSNNEWDNAIESMESSVSTTTERNESQNTSDLDFGELLPVQDNNTYVNSTKIHLPMLKNHTEYILDPDYLDMPDENITQSNNTNILVENMLTSGEKTWQQEKKEPTQHTSQIEGRKMIFYAGLEKDLKVLASKDDTATNNGDTNDIFEKQTVQVVKREIPDIATTQYEISPLLKDFNNSIHSLKKEVYEPLTNIINDKRNELRELEHMKENVMKYLKTYLKNETFPNANRSILGNSSISYLTVYKLALKSGLDHNNSKKAKPSQPDDYVFKLESDIYEVIKDIVEMQKNINPKTLPDNIKVLIRAMKYYVHKQGKLHVQKKVEKILNAPKNASRKQMTTNKVISNKAGDVIKQILTVIDKDMPQSNALSGLSLGAKKIIMRIIKKYYHDGQANFDVNKLNDNITHDLTYVAIKWYRLTRNLVSSPLSEQLFSLKLLHLEILRDICKIDNALSMIQSFNRRNALIINERTVGNLALRIMEDIQIIRRKIKEIINLQNSYEMPIKKVQKLSKPKNKKETFLQQLKKILSNSKLDIRKMFNNKFKFLDKQSTNIHSKPREKLNYESSNTNLIRRKRSVKFNNAMNRIKNIIPIYLRGKVNVIRKSKLTKAKHY